MSCIPVSYVLHYRRMYISKLLTKLEWQFYIVQNVFCVLKFYLCNDQS